jgi:hypothetical protein
VARTRQVDDVVAEHATTYCGRPHRRKEVRPFESAVELPGVTWSVDGALLVELLTLPGEGGPARLVVHEIGLFAPLRKLLRTRHLRIEHAV